MNPEIGKEIKRQLELLLGADSKFIVVYEGPDPDKGSLTVSKADSVSVSHAIGMCSAAEAVFRVHVIRGVK